MRNHLRLAATLIAVLLVASACSNDPEPATGSASDSEGTPESAETTTEADTDGLSDFPPAPEFPTGDLGASIRSDLDSLFGTLTTDPDLEALGRIGESADPRLAWLLTDLLRFTGPGSPLHGATLEAWEELTQTAVEPVRSDWGFTTDHMIAWDTPAPPDYTAWKRIIFELIEPGWAPFFDDADALIDWRWLSWGGVLIDDRPLNQADLGCPRGCIPALNDPGLVAAGTDDDWLADDRLVFGVAVNGEAVAFPKNMMEVHEMVNITIGGRRLGIPYCTLCGSAQAYFTDDIEPGIDLGDPAAGGGATYELRTSGLLTRSNKVMYEFHTKSVFDTFTGEAVSGPLREAGVALEQASVITTTWGAWKATHPESQLVAADGGIGRVYADDPLRGRDDDGPIFPIGTVDDRLGVQESVVGVLAADGTPIAFPAATARAALANGETVELNGVSLSSSGDGFVAAAADGAELAAHQAFWFAWSQFRPDTLLWLG